MESPSLYLEIEELAATPVRPSTPWLRQLALVALAFVAGVVVASRRTPPVHASPSTEPPPVVLAVEPWSVAALPDTAPLPAARPTASAPAPARRPGQRARAGDAAPPAGRRTNAPPSR